MSDDIVRQPRTITVKRGAAIFKRYASAAEVYWGPTGPSVPERLDAQERSDYLKFVAWLRWNIDEMAAEANSPGDSNGQAQQVSG